MSAAAVCLVAVASCATAAAPTASSDALSPPKPWLKSRQRADGSWDGDAASTGLALLAFLGAGETPRSGSSRVTVKGGLDWLRGVQDAAGCIGPRESPYARRDHAVAALALVEAYGMTGSKDLRGPATRAAAFVLREFDESEDVTDIEALGWEAMVFKSAAMSEIDADGALRAALGRIASAVDAATDPATGRIAGPPGGPQTAVGLLVRIFAGRTPKTDDVMSRSADALLVDRPAWDAATDLERTYFGTLSLYQFGGRRWAPWSAALTRMLAEHQRLDPADAEHGSWDPIGAGTIATTRVRATALCCLMSELYYRIGDMDAWRKAEDKWNR